MIRIKMVKKIFENKLNELPFIEKIDFKDKGLIAEAMYDAYQQTPDYENDSVEDFKEEIDNLQNQLYGEIIEEACLYAKSNNQVISGIFVCDFKGEATMTYCFTKKEYRGRGLAEALIMHAENKLIELGYDHFYLYLTLSNQVAFNLFESLGFIETEIK